MLRGQLRVGELVTTPETLASWHRLHGALEFSVGNRTRRRLEVAFQHRDTTLTVIRSIIRTEPNHLSPDREGPNDGRRSFECVVGFGSIHSHSVYYCITGFETKIECTLAARQWFIAYGISPDSPGGWL